MIEEPVFIPLYLTLLVCIFVGVGTGFFFYFKGCSALYSMSAAFVICLVLSFGGQAIVKDVINGDGKVVEAHANAQQYSFLETYYNNRFFSRRYQLGKKDYIRAQNHFSEQMKSFEGVSAEGWVGYVTFADVTRNGDLKIEVTDGGKVLFIFELDFGMTEEENDLYLDFMEIQKGDFVEFSADISKILPAFDKSLLVYDRTWREGVVVFGDLKTIDIISDKYPKEDVVKGEAK